MHIEDIREYCMLKKGTTEETPFGPDTLVYKVMGKIYALMNLDGDLSINLKCDPEKAVELREKYMCVQSGYHMNKTHWNTIQIDGSINKSLIYEWIDHSYCLVFSSLTKRQKDKLTGL